MTAPRRSRSSRGPRVATVGRRALLPVIRALLATCATASPSLSRGAGPIHPLDD